MKLEIDSWVICDIKFNKTDVFNEITNNSTNKELEWLWTDELMIFER